MVLGSSRLGASTVNISGLTDASGNAVTNLITITGYPKLFTGPGTIVVPRPFTVRQPTNLTLPQAVWTASIQGWPAGLTFWTDATTNVYALTNVLTTNVWTYSSQLVSAVMQFLATNNYVAGQNISLTTNWSGGLPTIAINLASLLNGLNLTNGSQSGTFAYTNSLVWQDSGGNIRLSFQPTFSSLNYPNGQSAFNAQGGDGQVFDPAGGLVFNINPGVLDIESPEVVVGEFGSSGNWTNLAAGQSWDWNVPADANTVATQKWVTNTIQVLTTNGANISLTTNANGALVIAVTGLGTAAFQNIGAFAQTANNLADLANAYTAGTNIGSYNYSNNPAILGPANLAGITGKYPGQLLATEGGGNGGNRTHQLWVWNTNSGTANWDSGWDFFGSLYSFTSSPLNTAGAYSGHVLATSNGVDNVLSLQCFDTRHYAAILGVDEANTWHFAFGSGGTNAPFYNDTVYLELNGANNGINPFAVVQGGKYFWGAEGFNSHFVTGGSLGDFVRWKNGTTNADPTNVVFRITSSGQVESAGELDVTNVVRLGPIADIYIAGAHNVNIGGTANVGNASFGLLALNSSGTWGGYGTLQFPLNNIANWQFFSGINGNLDLGVYTSSQQMIMHFDKSGTYIGTTNLVVGSTNAPASGSVLDIESTTGGLLPPRMTKAQRNAISAPAAGMVIFQTDSTPGLRTWNGNNWMRYTETTD